MLRLDTFIVAEFVSMLNFFYKKMPGSRLATPTFIIEPEKRRPKGDPLNFQSKYDIIFIRRRSIKCLRSFSYSI